jgi:hypothetical protein
MVNVSTATHFALVSPMVDTLGRDNAHIVASSHQMQLAAEGTTERSLAITSGKTGR